MYWVGCVVIRGAHRLDDPVSNLIMALYGRTLAARLAQ